MPAHKGNVSNRLANQRHHLHKTRCCLPLLVISHTTAGAPVTLVSLSATQRQVCDTARPPTYTHTHAHNRPRCSQCCLAGTSSTSQPAGHTRSQQARLPALVLCNRPDQHKAAFTPHRPTPRHHGRAVTHPHPPLRASRTPSHQHHSRPSCLTARTDAEKAALCYRQANCDAPAAGTWTSCV